MQKKSPPTASSALPRRLVAIVFTLCACTGARAQETVIRHGHLLLRFNGAMESLVAATFPGSAPLTAGFAPAEKLETKYYTTSGFRLLATDSGRIAGPAGAGTEWRLTGTDSTHGLKKIVRVTCFDRFADAAWFSVTYVNTGSQEIELKRWINAQYELLPARDTVPFWTFQGSSHSDRRDWIRKVRRGFQEKNFMGMNASDYGGGIPVTDCWRPDAGLAVGYTGALAAPVSLPVDFDRNRNTLQTGVEETVAGSSLAPGDSLQTRQTFVSVHRGDCFATLRQYGAYMEMLGVKAATPEPQAFEPVWCAWGYERDFKLKEILATLPKVHALGIRWVGLDDGFQQAEGDWHTNPGHFPGGDAEMKAFVGSIHAAGMKAVLWWAPLAADPDSKWATAHRASLLLQENGAPQFITWWNSFYMAPTDTATLAAIRETVTMFMKDWGFDALKLDGQHMNACAPDFGDGHGITDPQQAVEQMPLVFKTIYETARSLKPGAVVEFCPCGDCVDIYHMPYTNQFVASDPLNSRQVRLKAKVLKALMPSTAYFGDHVELTDSARDFASQLGVGAVPGTKFVWPATGVASKDANLLTPEKELLFRKALALYDRYHLSTGIYRGELYDYGYDFPEAHCIEKDGKMYYAFFAPHFRGTLDLRGLSPDKTYTARDYFNNRTLGKVSGKTGRIAATFDSFLLIEAQP